MFRRRFPVHIGELLVTVNGHRRRQIHCANDHLSPNLSHLDLNQWPQLERAYPFVSGARHSVDRVQRSRQQATQVVHREPIYPIAPRGASQRHASNRADCAIILLKRPQIIPKSTHRLEQFKSN